MVYRKFYKKNYKKKVYRKRTYKPKYKKAIIPRAKMNVHHFKRAFSGGITIPSTAATTQYFAYTFSLSQIVNASEFTSLFDQYRINRIVMRFRLAVDTANYVGVPTGIVPRMFWFIDYDDATAPASLNEFRERPKCKQTTLSAYKPTIVKFTPAVLVTGYESGVSSMYMPKFKQWIDIADPTTQHFGVKFAIDQFAENVTPFNVEIETWFYFSCKNVR